MPQTFSFEEATKPRTFSFEEALGTDAGPSAVEKAAVAAEPSVTSTLKVLKAAGQGYPVAEAGANLASGMIAMPIAGIAGLLAGGDPEVVRKVSEALTYQPRSEGGKLLTGGAQYPLEKLAEGADIAGQKVLDNTGSPALATVVNTAIQAAPLALGLRAKPGAKFSFEDAVKPEAPPEAAMPEARVEPTMKGETPVVPEVAGKVEPTLAAEAAVIPSDNPVLNAKVEDSHKAILAEQAAKQVEQPQVPPEDTTVNLMIGVSPAEALKAVKESYSPFVGVPVELRKRAPIGDALLKIFAPAARGEEAALTGNIVRANLGKQ